jgi:hypothetical protein
MRRPHFEDHLVLFAQIKRLDMTPLAQIPNVHLMAVPALQ